MHIASDPRVRSGMLTASEWYFNGEYVDHHYKPKTFTAGAVLHATKRLSVFYNMSQNSGQPRFDRTVLPTGDVAVPIELRPGDTTTRSLTRLAVFWDIPIAGNRATADLLLATIAAAHPGSSRPPTPVGTADGTADGPTEPGANVSSWMDRR